MAPTLPAVCLADSGLPDRPARRVAASAPEMRGKQPRVRPPCGRRTPVFGRSPGCRTPTACRAFEAQRHTPEYENRFRDGRACSSVAAAWPPWRRVGFPPPPGAKTHHGGSCRSARPAVAGFQAVVATGDITERRERVPEGIDRLGPGNVGRPSVLLGLVPPPPALVIAGGICDAVIPMVLRTADLVRLAAQPGENVVHARLYHSYPCSLPHRSQASAALSRVPRSAGGAGSAPVIFRSARGQWPGWRAAVIGRAEER